MVLDIRYVSKKAVRLNAIIFPASILILALNAMFPWASGILSAIIAPAFAYYAVLPLIMAVAYYDSPVFWAVSASTAGLAFFNLRNSNVPPAMIALATIYSLSIVSSFAIGIRELFSERKRQGQDSNLRGQKPTR